MSDDRLKRIEDKVDRMGEAMGKLIDVVMATNVRLDQTNASLSARLDQTNAKLDQHTRILDDHSRILDDHSRQLAQLQSDVTEIKQVTGSNHIRLSGRVDQVADMLRGHMEGHGHTHPKAEAAD